MIDPQDLKDDELSIKNLAFAMLSLAIADIGEHRGGVKMPVYAQSARRWVSDIKPGDDSTPMTFACACAMFNLSPEKTRKQILSKEGAKRVYAYPTQRPDTRSRAKTWWKGTTSKKHQCGYCNKAIPPKTVCYNRSVATRMIFAHLECAEADKRPKTRCMGWRNDRKKAEAQK